MGHNPMNCDWIIIPPYPHRVALFESDGEDYNQYGDPRRLK